MMDHQASNGTVTINQNGTYTYASNKNFTGNDSFTYKSNDIYGDSNIATVKVNVHPVNHAPVSNNLTFDIETNNNLTGELKVTDARWRSNNLQFIKQHISRKYYTKS